MLNRRTLRIKVMQALFAGKQRFEANYQIAKENLESHYSPDLNSMEIQDPQLLKQQKKEAIKVLEKLYKGKESTSPSIDEDILQTVNDEITNIENQNQKDIRALRVNMISDVEKLKCYYISIIELILEFHHHAKNETKKDHSNFVNNLLIKSIYLNPSLEKTILDCGKKWEGNSEVRSWYKNLISLNEEYIKYLSLENPGFTEDKDLMVFVIKKIIFNSDVIDSYLDDKDLFWVENKPIIKSLVLKSIKNMDSESEFEILDVSYNFEDDMAFFEKLFDVSVKLDDEYKDLISKKAVNWDIDRLATTDRIILEMAISEMIFFPSIPVKVTINEYIELSKLYSTPKSKLFINGMLDVIAEELKKMGVVKKSGRGLMDNK
ncbi:MAG: transcription antitermination factor NusB [Cyclobacteriaceae bacterium]|nr:transcription antitermination factor NusB [Cyclobacteriaceae bacterium]